MQINNYQNYHETKQHTTAEFPYNTYPCSIPLDFTRVPLHWHDELELIVIKKGHGLISVDFQKKIVIEASRRRSWPSAAVMWFSTVLTLIRSCSAISRFESPS